jgi:hypothetical protein
MGRKGSSHDNPYRGGKGGVMKTHIGEKREES